jgi:UDP-hydrolysing UDP-N-acetyl-D-glucosamine 2-epimerase
MNKIALVTGARAEYWLLRPLISKLQKLQSFMLFVTGEHLSGPGLEKIQADNFDVKEKIKCLSEDDSYLGMALAISNGISNFAHVFDQHKSDIVVLLGDRYETFAAAAAAYSLKIPIAHIHGGEVTHGALDDGFRHTISKMAGLHFVCHDVYKKRLISMGENLSNIYNVGAIGLDNIFNFMPNKDCLTFNNHPILKTDKYFLLTLHSSTLGAESAESQADSVIDALSRFSAYKIVVTQSNRDPDGILLNKKWLRWEKENKNVIFIPILGDDYLHVASYSELVIGNSSSGILEIPYLDRPVLNIGSRQDGRVFPKGVFCTNFNATDIEENINLILASYKNSEKIYGTPGCISEKIYNIVSSIPTQLLIYKKFYDAK